MTTELSFKPLKRNLWTDFEELFGPNGACAGCWCMFWKLRGKAYEEARGYETRQMHKSIVDSGIVTGLLAYLHGEVVGWIAVEPRECLSQAGTFAHAQTGGRSTSLVGDLFLCGEEIPPQGDHG